MKIWLGLALALILAVSGIYLLSRDKQSGANQNIEEKESLGRAIQKHDASLQMPDDSIKNEQDTLDKALQSQAYKNHSMHTSLQDSITEYFDNHTTISKEEKIKTAKEIEAKINELESRNEIIPLEALSLKLALVKTTTSDAEYPQLAKNLTEQYQDRIAAEEPEIDHNRNAIYKQREREVLLEVQAMSQYPNGMSQSEYLRHRLQLLRTEVFEGSN